MVDTMTFMQPAFSHRTFSRNWPARDSRGWSAAAGGLEYLHVLRDLPNRLLAALVASMMHQLIFQRAPETLHGGVVVAIAFAAHRDPHAELAQ